MPKESTLALVQTLSGGQADTILCDFYYREVVYMLAQRGWIVNATLIPPVVGQATYQYPPGAVDALHYFYGDTMLLEARLRELETINPHWRDEKGTPYAAVRMGESDKTFRLYPAPTIAPSTFAFLFGEDFGRGYPDGTMALIHSEYQETLPTYWDIPIALLVLGYEFERDSNHRDSTFAKTCREIGMQLFALIDPTGA